MAQQKLMAINSEIKLFDDRITDYGYSMAKLGNPELITSSIKQVEAIKIELENMNILWTFTMDTLNTF